MITVALIGNPNVGKTAAFNQLTGMKEHVGNWPGVTVEKKTGKCLYGDDMARDVIEVDVICNSVSDDTGRTHFISNYWNRALLAWNANTCIK